MRAGVWLLVVCFLGPSILSEAQTGANGFRNNPSETTWSSEPVAAQQRWEAIINETGGVLALHEALIVRLSGPGVVPFTLDTQAILAKAFQQVVIPNLGPVEIVSYRENYPKPGYSDKVGSTEPYVDFAGNLYHLFNLSMPNLNISDTWTQAWTDEFTNFLMWGAKAQTMGLNASIRLMSVNINEMVMTHSVDLVPVVPVEVMVAVSTLDGSNLTAAQASSVAEGLQGQLGAHIDVMAWNTQDALDMFDATFDYGNGSQLMVLDISLPACENANNTGWESCALSTLQFKLLDLFVSNAVVAWLDKNGMSSPRLAGIRLRPSPQAPDQLQAPAAVPWHLDRLDQRTLPLDGQYTADNGGLGVNVFLLSGGIDAAHTEFERTDGVPGTRIKAGWGYNGTDPLEDCPDAFAWYGFGTYSASLIGGNTLGVAKNATITSVRFRTSCMLESTNIWAPGGLPSAIDAVLSTAVAPAIMMIETWWSPNRFSSDDDQWIEQALKSRLDQAIAQNITVIVPAGFGDAPACDNVLAAHPGTIVASGFDDFDRLTLFGAANSSCISLWAPGGGLGNGVLGAMAYSDYTSIIPRAFGATPLVTGLAAQYLSNNPTATPAEVRRALEEAATPDRVLMAGIASPNLMGYTNLRYNATTASAGGADAAAAGADGGGGGGLSTAAIVGIAVPLGIIFIIAKTGCMYYCFIWLKKHRAAQAAAQKMDGDWEIDEKRIEIVHRPDGEPWQLGEGSYGKVFKAVKDGVQVVAVKTLRCEEDPLRDQFVREIAMMRFVSRDANITQFYGAVVGAKSLMLVAEYMEGGDLRKAITADVRKRLVWGAGGKGVALDITRGLHFLHTSRVSHRDIKSSNVLLTRDGRAKLGDVGLARILEDQHQSDGFVGTFAWAAPELLMGQRCDERVDIWSLGTVLWEIVTQEMPMRGMLRPPLVPEECPQEVVAIIHACMQHDPKDRPSARAVYNMLLAAPPLAGFEDAASITESSPTSQSPADSMRSSSPDSRPTSPVAVVPGTAGGRSGAMSWPAQAFDSAVHGAHGAMRAVSPKLHSVVAQIQKRLRHHEAVAAGGTDRSSPGDSGAEGSAAQEGERQEKSPRSPFEKQDLAGHGMV
ncbi:hypothetical protein ACKKBF_B13530 [Auxenochlorella protothecoides x Auxenochlorella symbiontica]